MPFPFTFRLSVPGLSNPFGSGSGAARSAIPANPNSSNPASKSSNPAPAAHFAPKYQQQHRTSSSPVPRCPTPTPITSNTSRKRARGWDPATVAAEPSRSTTPLTTSGYLDTPGKYMRNFNMSADEFHEVELFAGSETELPPPAKRRRGLAGSIVSTALSAALIGTAVGLTVYRLWRDRGKEAPRLSHLQSYESDQDQQLLPPPPYDSKSGWTPTPPSPSPTAATPPLRITPASPTTPRGSSRRTQQNRSIRRTPKRAARPRIHHAPHSIPTRPEFDFSFNNTSVTAPAPVEDQVEDQMDWIGDKLSHLIEQGKRALGREVVVLSEAKEDEEDDGSGAWVEDGPSSSSHTHTHMSPSRTGSLKRGKRPQGLAPFTSSAYTQSANVSPSHSPRDFGGVLPSSSAPPMQYHFQTPPARTHTHTHTRGPSADGVGLGLFSPSTSFREDASQWESPEMRESMERARARFLQNRGS